MRNSRLLSALLAYAVFGLHKITTSLALYKPKALCLRFFIYPHPATAFPLGKLLALCQYIDMVCIYCGNATQVTNSRPQKRRTQTWRRRTCTTCGAIFTTLEAADLHSSLAVRHSPRKLEPFKRDRLFVSILKVMGHRENAIDDAEALIATIISNLLRQHQTAVLSPLDIAQQVFTTLEHFDTVASAQYRAYHKALLT